MGLSRTAIIISREVQPRKTWEGVGGGEGGCFVLRDFCWAFEAKGSINFCDYAFV